MDQHFSTSVDSKKVGCDRGKEATPFRMIHTAVRLGLSLCDRCESPNRFLPEIGQRRAHLKRALAEPNWDEFQEVKGPRGSELRRFTCERVYQNTTGSQGQFAFRLRWLRRGVWVAVVEESGPPPRPGPDRIGIFDRGKRQAAPTRERTRPPRKAAATRQENRPEKGQRVLSFRWQPKWLAPGHDRANGVN